MQRCRILYCSPVRLGFVGRQEWGPFMGKLKSWRLKRLGYFPLSTSHLRCFVTMLMPVSLPVFYTIVVLHKLLLPIIYTCYSLRLGSYNRGLPGFDNLSEKCYLAKILYKQSQYHTIWLHKLFTSTPVTYPKPYSLCSPQYSMTSHFEFLLFITLLVYILSFPLQRSTFVSLTL